MIPVVLDGKTCTDFGSITYGL
jgi:hypothetical protein